MLAEIDHKIMGSADRGVTGSVACAGICKQTGQGTMLQAAKSPLLSANLLSPPLCKTLTSYEAQGTGRGPEAMLKAGQLAS